MKNEQYVVYFQGPNGEEQTMDVTETDPPDGTVCAHFTKHDFSEVTSEWWVRIVPNESRDRLERLVTEYDEGDDPGLENVLAAMGADDIAKHYDMDVYDAGLMVAIVSETTDPRFNTYGLPEADAVEFLTNIQESMHQSYEGFSERDRIVIRAYLADIAYCVHLCKEDKEGNLKRSTLDPMLDEGGEE